MTWIYAEYLDVRIGHQDGGVEAENVGEGRDQDWDSSLPSQSIYLLQLGQAKSVVKGIYGRTVVVLAGGA